MVAGSSKPHVDGGLIPRRYCIRPLPAIKMTELSYYRTIEPLREVFWAPSERL